MADEPENLDARMEVIRLKNEELERKHKEILEDEESAKRENAIVDVKSRSADFPPAAHPYDNLELDFDVKDKDKELSVNPDYKPKNRRPMPRKDLLDEIPPDPVNFLREDGEDKGNVETTASNPRPPSNRNRINNNNRNRQDRPRPERNRNEGDNIIGDSPPRPRNQNQRPRPNPQQNQQQRSPPDAPKRSTHPQQLRSERRIVPAQNDDNRSGQSPQNPNRQRRPNNNRQPNKEGGERNNITVEITDGEVRSVKLKSSERTFGTGRVRPDNTQHFAVDTFDPNNSSENTQQDRSPHDKSRNRNPRNRRNQKPKEFQHPTLENIVITKTSVQDRLARIALDNETKASQPEAQPATIADNGN